MKQREDRRYLMKKKISGKAIAAIIAAQRMQISSLVKNMNLKAKKFPQTNGWGYCITYYKDGVANTIVLAGKVTWNGADYKVDKESYDKLKEYIDTLYK